MREVCIRVPLALPLTLLLSAILTACGNAVGDSSITPTPLPREMGIGAPRSFRLGLSSFPREPTEDSYQSAFKLAGEIGEIILIQRAPPWQEFVAGGTLSRETQDATQQEKRLAEENDLDVFFAIDPTDPADRGHLQGLPNNLAGKGFADKEVREAFLAYVKYVALNYEPAFLALGIEVNMYFERQPGDFDSFLSLYTESYHAVKEISPQTQVFPTFQLEAMENLLPGSTASSPKWALLGRFEPTIDLTVFSTYPSFVFDGPESIPPDYFSQIERYTKRPVAIAGAGYSSGPGRDGLNEGTEGQQAWFVRRVLDEAERLNLVFVIWSAGCDPVMTNPPFDLYNHMGLCRADGSHKPSWVMWTRQVERPFEQGE